MTYNDVFGGTINLTQVNCTTFTLLYGFKTTHSLYVMYLRTKGKKVVSTGLGVIGDIGKKTYNILLEDDEDSDATGKANVCILFVLLSTVLHRCVRKYICCLF